MCPPKNPRNASEDGRSKTRNSGTPSTKMSQKGRWAMKKKTGSCLLGKMPGMKSSDMWGFFHKPRNKDPGSPLNNQDSMEILFFCSWLRTSKVNLHGLKIDPRNLKIVTLANLENRSPLHPCLVSQLDVVGKFYPTFSRGPKFCLVAESVIFMNANSTLRIMEKTLLYTEWNSSVYRRVQWFLGYYG